MSAVALRGVSKNYGRFTAVRGVDLDIAEGEFVTLLGASGCGKTTCLRMIAGFVQPDHGRVLIGGEDITPLPSYRRQTGMVFQQYALFPHLTVGENVAFGLRVRRLGRAERDERTLEALRLVRLEAFADRYPAALSGGQKQRVALARAVVIRPRVLLLDEPLAALDLKLREELQGEIKRVQEALGLTTVFVTHDQDEAFGLSDRVVVMRDGRVLQVDTPTALYRNPGSLYVATFVGRANFLPGRVVECVAPTRLRFQLSAGGPALEIESPHCVTFALGDDCVVSFRPEDVRLEAGMANTVEARVTRAAYAGDTWLLTCTGPDESTLLVRLPASADVPQPGAAVSVSWHPERCLLFHADQDIAVTRTPEPVAPAAEPARSSQQRGGRWLWRPRLR